MLRVGQLLQVNEKEERAERYHKGRNLWGPSCGRDCMKDVGNDYKGKARNRRHRQF
jgi:hypothetical protein